ncbi:hypothetical protein FB446DRAFT_811647 [Lentinula raphanica]|nr:hypothetical protein FB446DRAFT_811647 [Lentinula raphanica]
MSPTTTTHGHAFMPSSTFTAHSTNSYTNYHTHPTITSIWTIIALTIVVTVVSGVLCYSIYSCYQTAAYQHRLHITELNCQRAQARISVKARLSSTKDGHTNEEYIEDRLLDFDIAKRLSFNMGNSNSMISSRSSAITDIDSPPLAAIYSTHNVPYMIHKSPISPILPCDYESAQKSPGPPAPIFFDSNHIPFYMPESPRSPLFDSKLAPVAGSLNTNSYDASPTVSSTFTSAMPILDASDCAKVTAFCPRPRSASTRQACKRVASSESLAEDPCPFSQVSSSPTTNVTSIGQLNISCNQVAS